MKSEVGDVPDNDRLAASLTSLGSGRRHDALIVHVYLSSVTPDKRSSVRRCSGVRTFSSSDRGASPTPSVDTATFNTSSANNTRARCTRVVTASARKCTTFPARALVRELLDLLDLLVVQPQTGAHLGVKQDFRQMHALKGHLPQPRRGLARQDIRDGGANLVGLGLVNRLMRRLLFLLQSVDLLLQLLDPLLNVAGPLCLIDRSLSAFVASFREPADLVGAEPQLFLNIRIKHQVRIDWLDVRRGRWRTGFGAWALVSG